MKYLCALIVASFALLSSSVSPAFAGCHRPSSHDLHYKLPREFPRVYHAFRKYWGSLWEEAAIVTFGESSWYTTAENGQYHGIFQMGTRERAKYGDSSTPEGQVKAAHDYFLDAGWRPWNGGCAI